MTDYAFLAILVVIAFFVWGRLMYCSGKTNGKHEGIKLCQSAHPSLHAPVECMHSWTPWAPVTLQKMAGDRRIKYDGLERNCTGCGDVERKAVTESGAPTRQHHLMPEPVRVAIEEGRRRATYTRGAR